MKKVKKILALIQEAFTILSTLILILKVKKDSLMKICPLGRCIALLINLILDYTMWISIKNAFTISMC